MRFVCVCVCACYRHRNDFANIWTIGYLPWQPVASANILTLFKWHTERKQNNLLWIEQTRLAIHNNTFVIRTSSTRRTNAANKTSAKLDKKDHWSNTFVCYNKNADEEENRNKAKEWAREKKKQKERNIDWFMGGKAADKFVFSCFDTNSVRCAREYFLLLTWYSLLLLLFLFVFDRRQCNSEIFWHTFGQWSGATVPHTAAKSGKYRFCFATVCSIQFSKRNRAWQFSLFPFFSFFFLVLFFRFIHLWPRSHFLRLCLFVGSCLAIVQAADARSISVCTSTVVLVTIG